MKEKMSCFFSKKRTFVSKTFHTVMADIFSSRDARRTDLLGLFANVSLTRSTLSTVTLGLPLLFTVLTSEFPLNICWRTCSYRTVGHKMPSRDRKPPSFNTPTGGE